GVEATSQSNVLGFGRNMDDPSNYEEMKERLKVAIEKYFRPEFLNRLDDIIVFHNLTREDLKHIIDIELTKVRQRLADRGLQLILTEESKDYIIDKGFNPDYGARPLRRAIENMIEDPMSESILRGEFKGKDTLTVTVGDTEDGPKLVFEATTKGEEALAGAGSASSGEGQPSGEEGGSD
ncbi:NDP-hexose 4-ketoreductase, partial [Tautonia sp. JC769]